MSHSKGRSSRWQDERGPTDTLCQLKSRRLLHSLRKIEFERRMTLKVNSRSSENHNSIGHMLLLRLLVVCSNSVSVLHRFRDITTLQCTWLHVTLNSPWLSIRNLTFQATNAFRFMWTQIFGGTSSEPETSRPQFLPAPAWPTPTCIRRPLGVIPSEFRR